MKITLLRLMSCNTFINKSFVGYKKRFKILSLQVFFNKYCSMVIGNNFKYTSIHVYVYHQNINTTDIKASIYPYVTLRTLLTESNN